MPSKSTAVAVNLSSKVTGDHTLIKGMLSVITKARTRLETLKNVAAASCVVHAIEHGNATPMNDFLAAVGDSERHDAIVKWAVSFGPFTWVRDEDTKRMRFGIDTPKRNAILEKNDKDNLVKDMVANPYWLYVPIKEVPPFNLTAAIIALVKKAEKVKADPERAAKSNLEGYDKLLELHNAMQAVA